MLNYLLITKSTNQIVALATITYYTKHRLIAVAPQAPPPPVSEHACLRATTTTYTPTCNDELVTKRTPRFLPSITLLVKMKVEELPWSWITFSLSYHSSLHRVKYFIYTTNKTYTQSWQILKSGKTQIYVIYHKLETRVFYARFSFDFTWFTTEIAWSWVVSKVQLQLNLCS